jgi:hypothetical protein
MAIPDDVWDDLIDMIDVVPGQLKNRGPLAIRWASEDLIDELIEVGHLKVDGGRLTRTRASVDAARLWPVLPEDGSAIGNLWSRAELGWNSTRRYEIAKRLLLATEQVAVGRGRGGSVRRLNGAGPRRRLPSQLVPSKPPRAEKEQECR